ISTTTASPYNIISLEALNNASLYPTGSKTASVSSFSMASSNFTLKPLTQTLLNQYGPIDNSSFIFEAGRPQYLYFNVPASLGESVVNGVALHFGAAGCDDTVVVVPVPTSTGSSTQVPGVALLATLSDRSTIVRIQMDVASSLCTSSNNISFNRCFTKTYQAYAVVNQNAITSSISTSFNVVCGDTCSLASTACSTSCMNCSGQTETGADTPVSRRYNMGSSSGTFTFFYNTVNVQDRIKVWNDGKLLNDTQCVGESRTISITYSSTSSIIRVDVEPNCACTNPSGCTGTVWTFVVYCLSKTTG
ncbi:unnamed protein product, partial [Rotaria socialis]